METHIPRGQGDDYFGFNLNLGIKDSEENIGTNTNDLNCQEELFRGALCKFYGIDRGSRRQIGIDLG